MDVQTSFYPQYGRKERDRGASERVWRKRQRYVFRKRSMGSRILWPVIGILVVLGLIWLIPWPTLSSVDVEDAAKVEASKDQPEQDSTKDQLEQPASEDQPKDEQALKSTPPPPKEKEMPSNSLPPSASTQLSPPVAQTPFVPSPPPPSPSKVEEAPKSFLAPSDYSYYDPNYYNPGYRYYEPVYWDYQPGYSGY